MEPLNELVTPTGYVEYPRDPKFRPLPEPERLLVMAKAYDGFGMTCLSCPFCPFVLMAGNRDGFTGFHMIISLFACLLMALVLRSRVAEIFRAKGWPSLFGTLASMAVAAVGLLGIALGSWIFGALFVVVFGAVVTTTHVVVYREFRKFDPNLPFLFSVRRLGRIIGAMMAKAELKPPTVEIEVG